MSDINEFTLVRQDGKLMTQDMSFADLKRLGWQISPIVAVTWRHAGQPVTISVIAGSLAQMVHGSRYIAIIARQSGGLPTELLIFCSNGKLHQKISNRQNINGVKVAVEFQWFEKPVIEIENSFQVVVYIARGVTYQLEIDAVSGKVLHAKETR